MREVKEAPAKFVLSTLIPPLSHAQTSKRLLIFLSVPVAQLIKACDTVLKVVGSNIKVIKPFLSLSIFRLNKFLMIMHVKDRVGRSKGVCSK